jgi:methyl-CpG-binding domain protein 4
MFIGRVDMPRTLRKRADKAPATPAIPLRTANPSRISQPPGLPFKLRRAKFGLIQEHIRTSLYALVVQAILWNQTRGTMARPVLFALLAKYPTPEELSAASLDELTAMLQPLGLHNLRAVRLIALANAWLAAPPCKERRYRRLHYPVRGSSADVKPSEILDFDDEREGWEIAHLPGMGAYALDSYRIFYRDNLRNIDVKDGVEPEWKRVTADDKDLKAYLKWRWEKG